jgi:hypothetical protein
MSGFPWREHRCWCGKIGIMNFQGEVFCSWHIPYREIVLTDLGPRLQDIVGKEKYSAMIDEWFPTEKVFDWVKCVTYLQTAIEQLGMETGLLLLENP